MQSLHRGTQTARKRQRDDCEISLVLFYIFLARLTILWDVKDLRIGDIENPGVIDSVNA